MTDATQVKEALEPFAKISRAMYVSGHCGGASPEDWPSRWSVGIEGFDGKSLHTPQSFGGSLTVADFRRLEEVYNDLCAPSPAVLDPDTVEELPQSFEETIDFIYEVQNMHDATLKAEKLWPAIRALLAQPTGRVPDRETFWLVERIGHQQYIKDHSELPTLTNDPWRAARFATEREAHDFWLRLATLRDECKPVEHMFVNKLAQPTGKPEPVAGPMEFNKPEPTDKDAETLAEMRAQLWAAGATLEDAEFIAKMLWRNGFDITKRAAPASNPQEAMVKDLQQWRSDVVGLRDLAIDHKVEEIEARCLDILMSHPLYPIKGGNV